jgi:hypothetical protein
MNTKMIRPHEARLGMTVTGVLLDALGRIEPPGMKRKGVYPRIVRIDRRPHGELRLALAQPGSSRHSDVYQLTPYDQLLIVDEDR